MAQAHGVAQSSRSPNSASRISWFSKLIGQVSIVKVSSDDKTTEMENRNREGGRLSGPREVSVAGEQLCPTHPGGYKNL